MTERPTSAEVFVTEEAASSSNSRKPQHYSMDCDDDTFEEWWWTTSDTMQDTSADTMQDTSAGTMQVCSAGIADVATCTLKGEAYGDNIPADIANSFGDDSQDTSSSTLQVGAAGTPQDCSAFTEDFTCASWSTTSPSRRPAEAAALPCENKSSATTQQTNVLSFDFNVRNDIKCKIVSYSVPQVFVPRVPLRELCQKQI